MAGISYQIEVHHAGLGRRRIVTGRDRRIVQLKAAEQEQRWEEQWQRRLEAERKKRERERRQQEEADALREAETQTREARAAVEALENILAHTLDVDDRIDWNSLYDHREFQAPPLPDPSYASFPSEPSEHDYEPKLGILDRLSSKRRQEKEENATKRYGIAVEEWRRQVRRIEESNDERRLAYERSAKRIDNERRAFYDERSRRNEAIEEQCRKYLAKNPDAVEEYCDLVLSRSEYPELFPRRWELQFQPETGIAVVNYQLPSKDEMPTLKEVKYIKTRKEFKSYDLAASTVNSLYDSCLYQTCLRTIHELFEADAVDAVKAVVFNGVVTSVDRSTGNEVTACVMSLQAGREEFLAINLGQVDPKDCFKGLKGVGSSKLHGLAPVAPIVKLEKDDTRFVEAYSVTEDIDSSSNLASMHWEDFEHLIRELFESEFAAGDGEVKVTRASRDGGVDAVAFDPDPIRGGKIVIQAKRYTATVGVSAIRDLYGTVVNEGATKGILVTTSNYGPDAYEFARDKPLTLMNGANLLHLLERHGRRARIDLAEAKREAAESR